MWWQPEIVVMITLGREKLMQHMLLGVHEVTEQCVVVVLDELSCRWPVSRVETGPDSSTHWWSVGDEMSMQTEVDRVTADAQSDRRCSW